MTLDIGQLYKSFIDFCKIYKPSGGLMDKINQFCDKYPTAEPAKMFLYQRASVDGGWE